MLRRLRQAVELDCDRRVLAAHPDTRAYAGLLLSVAGRSQASLLSAAGMATTVSALEQRFRSMTINPTPNRGYRFICALAVVPLLLVATAMIPRPVLGVQHDASIFTTQSRARATGRVKVTSVSGFATYKVYATGGAFAGLGKPVRAKSDTLAEPFGAFGPAGDVFNIDVTDGDVHFVSQDASSIHVEAAMSGASTASWLSATSRHIIIDRGGAGIRGSR
jgi:hypothetical protein